MSDDMQTLTTILQELQAQNAGVREQNAAMARAVESQQRALETLLTKREAGVVDVKQVGKPDLLKGKKDEIKREFQNWAFSSLGFRRSFQMPKRSWNGRQNMARQSSTWMMPFWNILNGRNLSSPSSASCMPAW